MAREGVEVKMTAHHLQGRAALSKYLQLTMEQNKGSSVRVVCIFDFDRTLTNGTSFQPNASLDRRIRGGKHTLTALEKISAAGAQFYIVTARSPRELVIKQVRESFKNAQRELGSLFDASGKVEITKFNDVELARGGNVYACGYQKASGVAHALIRDSQLAGNDSSPLQVHFFDDAVVNAALVARQLSSLLEKAGKKKLLSRIDLNVCWWDPFMEETGKNPSMDPVHSSNSDFNFHDYLEADLKMFGVDSKEREKRQQVYLKEEKEQGRKAPPPLAKKTKPKKMGNVEESHAGLANLFAKKG